MKKENTRDAIRHRFRSEVVYADLGDPVHPPHEAENSAEILDLSDAGMRMRIVRGVLMAGDMLRVRIPVTGTGAVVPTLAQVIWTKQQGSDACHAGLKFMI